LAIYYKFSPKRKSVAELKQALQCWITCHSINKADKNFTKRLNACVKAGGGHFEYSQWSANGLIIMFERPCFLRRKMVSAFRSS